MTLEDDKTSAFEHEIRKCSLPSDYISKPRTSENSSIPLDILRFHHSYGYQCKMNYNLSVINGSVLIYRSGNIITFIDLQNKKMEFRRTALGGGIGFICSNTDSSNFAVGENGLTPTIIIYEWPSLHVTAILHNGTTKAFSYLCFSPDGDMLCSQGSSPDFFLTIWNWREESIILRYQSTRQPSKCIFSQYNSNILVTAGNGHIKFWKIVKTFSGLKLEGEQGKFDKTPPTDMMTVLPMPQGMFLTGCDWGNMILWNWNTIQFEISKRSPKTCHNGPITTIFYDDANDRLLTLGMDGCVKVWSYSPIQKTEVFEEMHTLSCLPIDEYEMKMPAAFLSSVKQYPNDLNDESWIVQDAKGAIWKMKLSVKNESFAEECLLRAPAGKIVGLACSPTEFAFAALSEEGGLYIYDYSKRFLLGYKLYAERGASLMWIPEKVNSNGDEVLLGFESGIIRLISISFMKIEDNSSETNIIGEKYSNKDETGSNERGSEYNTISTLKSLKSKNKSIWTKRQMKSSSKVSENIKILDNKMKESLAEDRVLNFFLRQLLKPHKKSISVMSHNLNFTLFVTASEDGSIFLYDINRNNNSIKLNPIGFVQVGNPVTYIDWRPDKSDTLLVCCAKGQLTEINFSDKELKTKESSYELNVTMQHYYFKSKKYQILQDMQIKERVRENVKKSNMNENELEVMKEEHIVDSEERDELDPPLIPKIPNKILFGYYSESGNVKISVGGFDCGFIYEYNFDTADVISWSKIEAMMDTEATSFVHSPDKKYLILGMHDGNIMVIKLKAEDPSDLSDYWILPMHDGAVRKLSFSYDFHTLFSCGDDGNIFSYTFKEIEVQPASIDSKNSLLMNASSHEIPITDILDGERMLSLEEVRLQEKLKKDKEIRDIERAFVSDKLKSLRKRFIALLERNSKLPSSEQFSEEEFELHPELSKLTQTMIDEKMESLYRKYESELDKSKSELDRRADYFLNCLETLMPRVNSIRKNIKIDGYRLRKIPSCFLKAKEITFKQLNEQSSKLRNEKKEEISKRVPTKVQQTFATFEAILNAFVPLGNVDLSRMRVQAMRTLEKYVKSRQEMEKKLTEWDDLLTSKPNDKSYDKADMKALEEAKQTIGFYTFKSSPTYRVASHLRMTTIKKLHQLLEAQLLIHNKKLEFNGKLKKMLEKKVSLNAYLKHLSSEHEILRDGKFSEYEILFSKSEDTISKLKNIVQEVRQQPPKIDNFHNMKYHKLKKSLEDKMDWLAFPELLDDDLEERRNVLSTFEKKMAAIKRDRVFHNTEIIENAIAEEIELYDEEITSLSIEKNQLDFDLKYLECHTITLQEELYIIKEFEAQEEILNEKVEVKAVEKNKMIEKIQELESKIENRKQKIEDLADQQKNIISNFESAVVNSTAASLLQKIFKKKYKPTKIKTDNDSPEEESSSSDSSIDTSDEGDEFVLSIKVNDNICPNNCAPELLDMTLNLRSQRHKVEADMKSEIEQLDMLQKILEMSYKNLRSIEKAYQKCDEEFGIILKEKQKKLNDLDLVVVLKLSQIQQMTSTDDLRLSKYVLFSKDKLVKLNARTKELEDECEDQIKKHKSLEKHVHHLSIDRKFMKEKIALLKEELFVKMEKKFGMNVDITKLQHAVLHSYFLEAQNQLQKVKDIHEKGYAEWQHQLQMKQNKLTEVIAANSEKKSLLAALQDEKTKLDKYLKHQEKLSKSPLEAKLNAYLSDVEKLLKIKKNQQKEIDFLKEEIKKLNRKTKHGALPPLEFSNPIEIHQDEEDMMADDLFTFKTDITEVLINDERGYSYEEESENH